MRYNKQKLVTYSYVIMLIILLALGFWQLSRLHEKREYIRQVYHNLHHAPARGIDEAMDKYQKIRLEGDLDCQNLVWLYRRYPAAKNTPGSYAMIPVIHGKDRILVILGWVEDAHKQDLQQALCSMPRTSMEGILIDSEERIFLVPKNDLKNKIYFTIDIPEVSVGVGYPLMKFYLAALNYTATDLLRPINPEMMINIRNDHLEYAVTWFVFAGILTLFYFRVRRTWHIS